jgi:hypothetical protein
LLPGGPAVLVLSKRYGRLIHCLEKFALGPGDTLQPEWHSPDEIRMALRFIERLECTQEREEQKERERQWQLSQVGVMEGCPCVF